MKKIGMRCACACAVTLALALAGCGDDDSKSNDPSSSSDEIEIEIEGSWTSEFGAEEISSTSWAGSEVTMFDNDDNVAITRNPDDAEFDPGKYNRNVWTEPEGGSFYYCTPAYGLESEEDALSSTAPADDSDPATNGCGEGSFAWTRLDAAD